MVSQGGLEAYVGGVLELVGDQERVGMDTAPGHGEGVEIPPKLKDLSGCRLRDGIDDRDLLRAAIGGGKGDGVIDHITSIQVLYRTLIERVGPGLDRKSVV